MSLVRRLGSRVMGVRITSLMAAAHAAGFAMAAEDMYCEDDVAPVRIIETSSSTALVPIAQPTVGVVATVRALAHRYAGGNWIAMARLPA